MAVVSFEGRPKIGQARNHAGPIAPAPAAGTARAADKHPAIPKDLRKEITQHVRAIAKKYRTAFDIDSQLKNRVARLVRALLPPRPRRPGRRRNPETTRMVLLYRKSRREHPDIKPREAWHKVALTLVPGYGTLGELEQRDVLDVLKTRMKSRLRKRQPAAHKRSLRRTIVR